MKALYGLVHTLLIAQVQKQLVRKATTAHSNEQSARLSHNLNLLIMFYVNKQQTFYL